MVLLHGYSDSRRSYDRILPLLPSSLRVFAVTQRGHGSSGKPETGYGPAEFAKDLAAFLDAIGIDSAIVVGHSMGSIVAQRFAIDYPARTRAVVLEGALAPRMGNHEVRELWKTVSTFTDPVDPAFVRDFQQSSIARPVPSDFFEGVVADSLKVPARVWTGALEPLTTLDFLPQLGRIAVPTLLIWGDRDAFVPRAEQDALIRAIAGSRLVTYAGTGHSPHWEEPDRYVADLTAFIWSVDRR